MADPWVRRVQIGDCVLYQGPSTINGFTRGGLLPHMARLAKSNKIFSHIGGFRCVKKPEWLNVMHWKRLSFVRATIRAASLLVADYYGSDRAPRFSSICGHAPNPTWRRGSGEYARRLEAFSGTKPSGSILFGKPRLLHEDLIAVFAAPFIAILPRLAFFTADATGEGIGRTQPNAKLVANHVRLWPVVQGFPGAEGPPALKGAKPRLIPAVRLHGVCDATFLANDIYHTQDVACPPFIGNETSGVAKPATIQPSQEALDL